MSWYRAIGPVARETFVQWIEDGVPARGAALAYYVLLSLGPFLVMVVGVLQFFLSEADVRSRVVTVIGTSLGGRASEVAATVLERVEVPDLLSAGSILTVALLLFGATAAFTNIRDSLNAIWGVEPEPESKRQVVLDFLRARALGFVMIVLTGLVLTVSMFFTSVTSLAADILEPRIPYSWILFQAGDALLSFLFIGLLFAAIYRTLPAIRIEWSTVWAGAFATALLFVVGKWLVAMVLATSSWTSYYGPGASLVAFLAWIYFSAQLFYLGAEFTQVWSRRRGGVMSSE